VPPASAPVPPASAPVPPASAQRPWYATTLPPGQVDGPVPWFARQQGAPAAPPPAPAAPPTPAAPPAPPRAYAAPPPAAAPPPPAPAAPPPAAAPPPPAPAAPPPAATPPPAAAPPAVAPAQSRVAQVVNRLTDVVLENWRSYPLDAETLSLLQIGLPYLTQRDCSRDALLAGQTVARLGYISRAAEYAEFADARVASAELFEELSESLEEAEKRGGSIADAMAEFAADLAISEPIDPPASDGGPSWVVPGVSGAVRGRLRDALLTGVRCADDITRQDLQHTWKYGYFLRCMEEFFFDED
jgi:hypothetical protein